MPDPLKKNAETPRAGSRKPEPGIDKTLATQAWVAVARCYHLCDAVLTQRLAVLGVRLQEHEVLINLLRAPELTQQELASRCFVTKSSVSMLVSTMESNGLLERLADAQDARIRRLTLTRQGAALARKCLKIQEDVVGAMTGGQPPDVLLKVHDAMRQASTVLDQMLQEKQQ